MVFPDSHTATGSVSQPLGLWHRLGMTAVGAGLLSLLVTATLLTPSQQGWGTHQQLGLPPCSIQVWFGIRCPSCGMTTAWSHFVRGQIVPALEANVGGALLAVLSVVVGPWLMGSGVRGRWLIRTPNEWLAASVCLGVFLITLVDWGYRLLVG